MKRLFFLFLALSSVYIFHASVKNVLTLSYFQNQVSELNKGQTSGSQLIANIITEDKHRLSLVNWDANLNYSLAAIENNLAYTDNNLARQEVLLSNAQHKYEKTLTLRPRDITALTSLLNLLIDQGAPADFVLNKLDHIISLTPKDQDLKAEISMICFKLLSIHNDQATHNRIINQLSRLFVYSMDYRGMTLVKRYSILYEQVEVLNQVLAGIE